MRGHVTLRDAAQGHVTLREATWERREGGQAVRQKTDVGTAPRSQAVLEFPRGRQVGRTVWDALV